MKLTLRTWLFLFILFSLPLHVHSQNATMETNLLSDATLSLNAGLEIGLKPQWTLDLSGSLNAWKMPGDRYWKHWSFQPELRRWLCDRFIGAFFGFHLHGGQYNIGNLDNGLKLLGTDFSKLSDSRYQGWFVGGGVGYGYSWPLNKSWNLEAEIGLGYSYTRYEKYPCAVCGEKEGEGTHHYLGVTKAALSLIYSF